ncbi:MAG: YggT family protein [Candidatus Saccharimonadales bacterium]
MVRETQVDVSQQHAVDENGEVVRSERVVRRDEHMASPTGVAQNIIYTIYGILASLLGLRMLLSLLAANRSNGFADLIYTVTGPFVAPFRSLFGVNTAIGNGGSHFELETLVAILVYGLLAWMIVRIVRVKKDATA